MYAHDDIDPCPKGDLGWRGYDPNYPGLCNPGTGDMRTQGKGVTLKAILAELATSPVRISLTGPAAYAGLSGSRYF